ncbi:MAG: 30S ribosomal protein S9 [bacterium]|nr:30S ribosomal protein S9 [bacterium]
MSKKIIKKDYTFAVGRRKDAVARVRLYKGVGDSVINEKATQVYFPGPAQAKIFSLPFEVTKTVGKYWISAKVAGGGKAGQLQAVTHGVSRALTIVDEDFRLMLRKHDLLTRDPRTRERRKIGKGGKARRKKQSPKR